MAKLIFSLCSLTALGCAWLLLRGYLRDRSPVLLWSGLCFVGLTLGNLLLIIDRFIMPQVDLLLWRLTVALIAVLLLVYGLVQGHD